MHYYHSGCTDSAEEKTTPVDKNPVQSPRGADNKLVNRAISAIMSLDNKARQNIVQTFVRKQVKEGADSEQDIIKNWFA